jgi:excisionase family DNA binding protein
MNHELQDQRQSLKTRLTVTVPEAAKCLSVSTETCYRWIREGRLPGAIRLGPGSVRVRTDALLALLQSENE